MHPIFVFCRSLKWNNNGEIGIKVPPSHFGCHIQRHLENVRDPSPWKREIVTKLWKTSSFINNSHWLLFTFRLLQSVVGCTDLLSSHPSVWFLSLFYLPIVLPYHCAQHYFNRHMYLYIFLYFISKGLSLSHTLTILKVGL